MGVKLSQIVADRDEAEMKVQLEDGSVETLHITYKPSKYTPEFEQRSTAALDLAKKGEGAGSTSLVDFITTIVVDWDLLDGEDTYPITTESVSKLPIVFIGEVIAAVGERMGKAIQDSAGT